MREGYTFDEARLAEWMTAFVPAFVGPVSTTQFKGGQSNPTYRVDTPEGTYVVRRKPPGHLVKGAHAVEREARVLMALETTGFPVAHVFALCTDASVIGTPFYVMEMIDGRILWDPSLPEIKPTQRCAYYDAMNATIARLHLIDYQCIGLTDYGGRGNYCQRQIARWSRQYLEDVAAGRDPHMDRLIDWLPAHMPTTDETSIVHGDFRIDNIIWHPTEARILAVLDWELSTLGDPLADFAYHLMVYRMPRLTIAGLSEHNLKELNIPNEADYISRYCHHTGRTGIPGLPFYMAFNLFRFAAICHGIKGRIERGTAASADARTLADDFPILAELAWRQTYAHTVV